MSVTDELSEILDEPKSFYFSKPLLLPDNLNEDRVKAYNLIFRKNDIKLKIEENFLMLSDNSHPNQIRVPLEKSGLLKELLDKLFGSYLQLKSDWDVDSYEVNSSYSKINVATNEEIEMIENLLNARKTAQFTDSSYIAYEFKFNDTDRYTVRLVKNLRDYAVKQDGGLWKCSILEIALKPETHKQLTSIGDESLEDFLNRFLETAIRILKKENDKYLDIVNDNEMIIDLLKMKIK